MVIEPCPHDLDHVFGKSTLPRTPGLHISDIYGDLYQRLQPDRYKSGGSPDPARLEMGLTFEEVLEEGLKARLGAFRPGEIMSPEGVRLSPDLLIPEGDDVRVGEIKLTWMSSSEMPTERATSLSPKFSKWGVQLASYCHVLGINLGRILALFINGDYRANRKPQLLAWNVEFSPRDLTENWDMLMRHARTMGVL